VEAGAARLRETAEASGLLSSSTPEAVAAGADSTLLATSALIKTASGQTAPIAEGSSLVFGRGPKVDLEIPGRRELSRRAGVVTAMTVGAWIVNISRTHALYVEGDGYRIRLPRLEDDSEPAEDWLLHAGTALIGTRAMLDEGQPLAVTVTVSRPLERLHLAQQQEDRTLLPLYLDPMTKLFVVALIWCRPWLLDEGATTPLPSPPEVARQVLEVTGAYHELDRFDTDPDYRDLMSARITEYIKTLRRKIIDHRFAASDVRLSDEVVVRILIEHGIITTTDLNRLADPAWCSRAEALRWALE